VISTRLNRYGKTHFRNCGSDKNPITTDIFMEDAINFEGMFDSWCRRNNYPVMCIKYETLYENRKIIESFIGKRIVLPSIKDRKPDIQMCRMRTLKESGKPMRFSLIRLK